MVNGNNTENTMDTKDLVKVLVTVAREQARDLGIFGITVRAGSGFATYWRHFPNTVAGGRLNFGAKMVDNQLNPHSRDTVRNEIDRFGWDQKFGCSPALRMAAVVLHELAHAVVTRDRMDSPGEVHGPAFYARLTKLVDERLEDLALKIAELAGSPALLDDPDLAEVKEYRTQRQAAIKEFRSNLRGGFKRGDNVEFIHRGVRHAGVILRWGGKRWTVIARPAEDPDDSWIQPSKWHVPARMLTKVAG